MDRDTHGIPPEVYQTITARDNAANAVAAMKTFLRERDERAFQTAVGLYVASARYRQEPIEQVVAALCTLSEDVEGPKREGEILSRQSRMHELVFTGILKAFYGELVVERALGASAQRKADARQHIESGTWPRRPED